jgi:hypothetical protein
VVLVSFYEAQPAGGFIGQSVPLSINADLAVNPSVALRLASNNRDSVMLTTFFAALGYASSGRTEILRHLV